MPKRARDAGDKLDANLKKLFDSADESVADKICLASLEWEEWDESSTPPDYFVKLRPFVDSLDEEATEAKLFNEVATLTDEQVAMIAFLTNGGNWRGEGGAPGRRRAEFCPRQRLSARHEGCTYKKSIFF